LFPAVTDFVLPALVAFFTISLFVFQEYLKNFPKTTIFIKSALLLLKMNNQLIEGVLSSVNNQLYLKADSFIRLNEEGLSNIKLSKDNFQTIKNENSKNTSINGVLPISSLKIAFIDGGNTQIIDAPGLVVSFIRVYHTIYKNNERIDCKKKEFFVVITAYEENDNLIHKAELFSNEGEEKQVMLFNEDDIFKNSKKDFNKGIACHVTNILELKEAMHLIKQDKDCVIVRDGTLQPATIHEKVLFNNIFDDGKICGVAKTTNLLTDKGNTASRALINLEKENNIESPWFYHVEGENLACKFNIGFVKLHEKSNYVFRFEALKGFDIDPILSLLVENSKDPAFLGYPYGLVEADRFARATNNEQEYYKMIFMSKLGGKFNDVLNFENASNAHDILDNM